jgi:hypothetical protein
LQPGILTALFLGFHYRSSHYSSPYNDAHCYANSNSNLYPISSTYICANICSYLSDNADSNKTTYISTDSTANVCTNFPTNLHANWSAFITTKQTTITTANSSTLVTAH